MALFPNMGITISLTKFGSDIILSPGTTSNVEQFRAVMGFDDATWASINDFILRGDQTYFNVRTTGQNGKIYLSLVRREYISGNGPVIFFLSFEESHLFPQNYRDSSYLILKGQNIISWNGGLPASPQQLIEEYYKRDAKEKTRTQIIHFVHNGAEVYGLSLIHI